MSKPFINDDFLLTTPAARKLYHEYAESMPLYDFHSHLIPQQIRDNVKFKNITQAWLYGDHYKWRAMRACGVPEHLVSGIPEAGDDFDRFKAWAATVPQTMLNPLHHWTQLELKRYFGIDTLLSADTAKEIYEEANAQITGDNFSSQSLINRSNVKLLCTTDDPADDLANHIALAKTDWNVAVYPAWRPDKALAGNDPVLFNSWMGRLEKAVGSKISSYREMKDALWARHQFFHANGCRLSDYGIEQPYAEPYTEMQVEEAFKKLRAGAALEGVELERYRACALFDLLCMDARQDWTQQMHFGAKRNTNSKAYALRGPDTGYDVIGDFAICDRLIALLDRLAREDCLTRTVLFVLNPSDNDMIASILGSYQDGKTIGKFQFGPPWWHNDHKDGFMRHFSALANIGLLSRYVGMETDSRSFLSYPRHEYFRRVLCYMLGLNMESGDLPDDYPLVGKMAQDICYNNAVEYFKLKLK